MAVSTCFKSPPASTAFSLFKLLVKYVCVGVPRHVAAYTVSHPRKKQFRGWKRFVLPMLQLLMRHSVRLSSLVSPQLQTQNVLWIV